MLSAGFWMTIATFPSKTVWSVELMVPFETEFQDAAESEETSYEDLVHKANRYLLLSRTFNVWRVWVASSKQVGVAVNMVVVSGFILGTCKAYTTLSGGLCGGSGTSTLKVITNAIL